MGRKSQGSPAAPPKAEHGFFEGIRAVFIEGGVLGKRLEIWKKRLIGLGGKVLEPGKSIPRDATHVLAADAERLIKQYSQEQVEASTKNLVSFAWLEESLAQGKLLPPNAYRVFSSSRSVSLDRSVNRSRSASPDTAQSQRGGSLLESPKASAHPPAPKTPVTSAQKRLREAHERAEDLAAEVLRDNVESGVGFGGLETGADLGGRSEETERKSGIAAGGSKTGADSGGGSREAKGKGPEELERERNSGVVVERGQGESEGLKEKRVNEKGLGKERVDETGIENEGHSERVGFEKEDEGDRAMLVENERLGLRPLGPVAEAIGREVLRLEPSGGVGKTGNSGGVESEARPALSGGGSDEEQEILQRMEKRRRLENGVSAGLETVLETDLESGSGALVPLNEEGFLDLRENQTPAGMANPDLNRGLLKVLGELKDIYRDAFGDDRRSFSYYKAISVVENLSFKVTNAEQLKGLPSIGRSLLDKVRDILGTGTTPRLEALKTDPMVRILFEFGSVWGIGPVTARKLYDMGHCSLDDLKSEPSLTAAQRVGLKFFYDIQQRIPRHEAAEMEGLCQRVAAELCPGIELLCGGSYRRGKASCGDMDMVITHPDGHSHKGLLPKLVARLKEIDFVTEDLLGGPSHSQDETDHGVDTYFGLCKYPGRELRHRIDFKVYPRDKYAFGLLAWTGNDVLNRRMRLIASDQKLHLNDHGMYPAIYREDDHVHHVSRGSESVPCYTERDIFRTLRVKFLEPTERNL